LSRITRKKLESKRKKKALIKKGIICTVTSGAILAGINSATALNKEENEKTEISKVQNISTNKIIDSNKYAESRLIETSATNSTDSNKTIDNIISKVEENHNLLESDSNKSKEDEKVILEEVYNILDELKIKGYINFNGEGDYVSPVDVFDGSKITISDRINPEILVTKENEASIFNPLKITGTEVMIVDDNIYKLDIDDYSTIYYEKIEDKSTINLFIKQIERANSSSTQLEQYNEIQRVQSNLNDLEITGIDLDKYNVEALGTELSFAPVLLAETYNKDIGKITAKYSGQMYYGDEVFIVTDNNNEIEGIYKIDNFDSSSLQKIKSSASISNILKQYKEKTNINPPK